MSGRIIDVRQNRDSEASYGGVNIHDAIVKALSRPVDQKYLPGLLLYDEEGLRLYDDITTHCDEYYLFPTEESLLKRHAYDIVQVMQGRHQDNGHHPAGGAVVELGAGSLRKTQLILSALSKTIPSPTSPAPITYYALDLDRRELERTLDELATSPIGREMQGKVDTRGLWGTYEYGFKWVEKGGLQDRGVAAELTRARSLSPNDTATQSGSTSSTEQDSADTPLSSPDWETPEPPLHMLFLGSSMGNFSRGEDAAFLRSLPLRTGKGDTILLGLDHESDAARIKRAYNNRGGFRDRWLFNGLNGAGRALGDESLFAPEKWECVGRYDEEKRRNDMFYRSRGAQTLRDPGSQVDFAFLEDELVHILSSHKYNEGDAYRLFTGANLRPLRRWMEPSSGYSLWLLERPPFNFQFLRIPASTLSNTPFGVPTLQEFQEMWTAWDFVTRKMVPDSMLLEKPIDLKHVCLFYIGHIPVFLDIQLSNHLGEPNTEPEYFKHIFGHDIGPSVDHPTEPHSKVPKRDEDWPSYLAILDFQKRVRARLSNLYAELESGRRPLTRKVARVLFMTLEHGSWYTETFLHMLLQRTGTGTIPPSVGGFATPCWESLAEAWDTAPDPSSATATLGPTTVELGHDDLETDDSSLDVKDHEFWWDNEHPRRKVEVGAYRIEWRPVTNGQFYEYWKAAEGKVSMPKSWVNQNGHVMIRTLFGAVPMKIGHHWPVTADFNSISVYAIARGGRLPTEAELRLFYDKFECGYEGGSNVGFRNWHPVPATTGGKDGGRGHNGGVWEWTSTVFDKHEGFEPSTLYPGFSADSFDTRHNVVIGGSYATNPRQAERRTVRRFFQRNYPYGWNGGRVAYDMAN